MIRMGARYIAPDGTLTREGYDALRGIETGVAALVARLDAAAAVADPAGGATIDAEARAALIAITGALA